MLERAKGDRGLTVKRLEKQIARREQDLKAKLDAPRDPGVTFENTGIDYLLCDFTSRRFRVRLVRSRGCGAGWRTRGQGLCAEASTSFARAWRPCEFSVRRRNEPEGEWSWLSENSALLSDWG